MRAGIELRSASPKPTSLTTLQPPSQPLASLSYHDAAEKLDRLSPEFVRFLRRDLVFGVQDLSGKWERQRVLQGRPRTLDVRFLEGRQRQGRRQRGEERKLQRFDQLLACQQLRLRRPGTRSKNRAIVRFLSLPRSGGEHMIFYFSALSSAADYSAKAPFGLKLPLTQFNTSTYSSIPQQTFY